MSKQEYMEELKGLLFELPEDEREEAIRYYDSYFAEAGEENEQQVISELGSAQRVAAQIIKDFQDEQAAGAYTEHGYQEKEDIQKETPVKYQETDKDGKQTESRQTTNDGSGVVVTKKGISTATLLLIILVGIIGFPLWISLFGVVFGIFAALFGIVFGFGIAAIALFAAGIMTLIFGIVKLFTIPLVGVLLLLVAMFVLGLGCLFTALTGACVKLVIWMIKGIIKLCSRIFNGKQVAAA